MLSSRYNALTALVIIYIPPGRPSYVLVSNFTDRKARSPKHMITANTAAASNVIQSIDANDQIVSPIWILTADINQSIQ